MYDSTRFDAFSFFDTSDATNPETSKIHTYKP